MSLPQKLRKQACHHIVLGGGQAPVSRAAGAAAAVTGRKRDPGCAGRNHQPECKPGLQRRGKPGDLGLPQDSGRKQKVSTGLARGRRWRARRGRPPPCGVQSYREHGEQTGLCLVPPGKRFSR